MLPITYAIRNLFRDPTRLVQTGGGSALVVVLVIAAAALNHGMNGVLEATGSKHNVILLGAGSEESVERSEVHLDAEAAELPGGALLQVLEVFRGEVDRVRVQAHQHALDGVFEQRAVVYLFHVTHADLVVHVGERAQLVQWQASRFFHRGLGYGRAQRQRGGSTRQAVANG